MGVQFGWVRGLIIGWPLCVVLFIESRDRPRTLDDEGTSRCNLLQYRSSPNTLLGPSMYKTPGGADPQGARAGYVSSARVIKNLHESAVSGGVAPQLRTVRPFLCNNPPGHIAHAPVQQVPCASTITHSERKQATFAHASDIGGVTHASQDKRRHSHQHHRAHKDSARRRKRRHTEAPLLFSWPRACG
jgi:hypothetical protein